MMRCKTERVFCSAARWVSTSAGSGGGDALYSGHVPINLFQQGLLAVGSAFATLRNTHRHGALFTSCSRRDDAALTEASRDMLAVLSETTSGPFLPPLLAEMRSTPSGRAILKDRPRITESSLDLPYLRSLPPGTLGREYTDWLSKNRVTPDTRDPVRYVSDPTHAYLLQRYRESHDFYHVLLGFGVSLPSELVVKWFELSNFRLPVAALSAVFGPIRMEKAERRRLMDTYASWALRCGARSKCLIGVYWEKEWDRKIVDLKDEFGISDPPVSMKEWRAEGRRIKAMQDSNLA